MTNIWNMIMTTNFTHVSWIGNNWSEACAIWCITKSPTALLNHDGWPVGVSRGTMNSTSEWRCFITKNTWGHGSDYRVKGYPCQGREGNSQSTRESRTMYPFKDDVQILWPYKSNPIINPSQLQLVKQSIYCGLLTVAYTHTELWNQWLSVITCVIITKQLWSSLS